MEVIKSRTISELRAARAEFLEVNKELLDYGIFVGWYNKWLPSFRRADGLGGNIEMNVGPNYARGFDSSVTDPDMWDDLRARIVRLLENVITNIDKKEVVMPILDELINKVSDVELAVLLKEFNAIKDSQPNLAAIGFRTILSLILKIRAHRENPTSGLATREDMALEPDLKEAISIGIFPEAETKLLKGFLNGGDKVVFDNIAHKVGGASLIDKDKLSNAVDNILNKLLRYIV